MPLRGKKLRGFPFDEESSGGAWSDLAARHPDIAARLRARPQTWARKRRPSGQDAADDFGDEFGGFDRFPFDDIPPEFREHFPTHWNRRHGQQEQPSQSYQHPPPQQPQAPPPPQQTNPKQTTATQTEHPPGPSTEDPQANLPQYGLRNTVDLGVKSPVDPSLVDADDRSQRSMSAPPESRNQGTNMSGQNQPPPQEPQHSGEANVRHIPIFVEGRDEPVINKNNAHYAESKPAYSSPPHVDRDQYFTDDVPAAFQHPPNFSRSFGTPFNKGFRQGPQPFVQQKVYPQTAFGRANSPHRSQSPKPHPQEDHFVKVPVHHEQAAPANAQHAPSKPQPQQRPQQPQQRPQQQQPQQQQPHQQPAEQAPPPPKPPGPNDPITQILSIQTDVLNLMTDVENFTGSKKDKRYLYLDEMLTRNLIKLDTIETEGKENIRQARKEAIRCIQKCIAVLEDKAEKGSAALRDIEMKETSNDATELKNKVENGEVEMKETTKDDERAPTDAQAHAENKVQNQVDIENKPTEETHDSHTAIPMPDAPPHDVKLDSQKAEEKKLSPKKKVVKKRDKSKDSKEAKDSIKNEKGETEPNKAVETMQVDEKGEKTQAMEVENAPASQ